MPLEYRSNEAVMTICQNNAAKTITISALNGAAEGLIGFSAAELVGKPIASILPPRIAELLLEYVEFEDYANDVGMVLSRVQSFSIIGKDGREKSYRLKLSQAESGGGALFFALVLQDTLGARKNEAIKGAIQQNFKGHESLDAATGLPDRTSLLKDIELMKYYRASSNINACFGVIRIDFYNELLAQNGKAVVDGLLKHLIVTARQSLRPDDVLGSIGGGKIAVLLVDAQPSSARMVFNRLRWQIAANPYVYTEKSSIGTSVSISFCNIDASFDEKEIISQCEQTLANLPPEATNTLIEVSVG